MAFIMCFPLFEVFFFFFDPQAVIQIRHSKVNELPLNSDDPGKYLFEIVPRKSKNNSTSISTCIKRSSTITAHVPKVAEGLKCLPLDLITNVNRCLFSIYDFNFAGSTVDRETCPYVFMANSQTDMEEWVRALRRVTGVPNGGSVKLHVLPEADSRSYYSRQ